jgi:hypothetical protein
MKIVTVPLDTPLTRGEKTFHAIDLRKPNGGALRGVSLLDLMRIETTAFCEVLPRITEPALTKQELALMDPVSLMDLGAAVAGFLVSDGVKAEAAQEVMAKQQGAE